MSAVWRAMCATLCFSVCVNAQTRTLAVYHDPAQNIDSTTIVELHKEIQRLLAPASMEVVWQQIRVRNPNEKFDKIAVASFDGDCSAAELPPLHPASGPVGVFADTAVGKEQQVQPFLRVNCAQVIRSLRPLFDHLSVPMRNVVFGRALARVMAHEIYHIVAQTREHAEAGVAKPSLSFEDLIAERFDFNPASLARLRSAPLFSQHAN